MFLASSSKSSPNSGHADSGCKIVVIVDAGMLCITLGYKVSCLSRDPLLWYLVLKTPFTPITFRLVDHTSRSHVPFFQWSQIQLLLLSTWLGSLFTIVLVIKTYSHAKDLPTMLVLCFCVNNEIHPQAPFLGIFLGCLSFKKFDEPTTVEVVEVDLPLCLDFSSLNL